ncbi:MAG: hypothetical protein V3T32_08000 [Thermodesulfobacteriota bacterium]
MVEYTILTFDTGSLIGALPSRLNEEAIEGWKFVSIVEQGGRFMEILMERETGNE